MLFELAQPVLINPRGFSILMHLCLLLPAKLSAKTNEFTFTLFVDTSVRPRNDILIVDALLGATLRLISLPFLTESRIEKGVWLLQLLGSVSPELRTTFSAEGSSVALAASIDITHA